jgi:hypothetical protein
MRSTAAFAAETARPKLTRSTRPPPDSLVKQTEQYWKSQFGGLKG